jgi:molybdopterin biosynthesis enzyme
MHHLPAAASAAWHAALEPLPTVEIVRLGLADALGRVTAAPIRPLRPSPRFACADLDGIAVRAAESSRPGRQTAQRWRFDDRR